MRRGVQAQAHREGQSPFLESHPLPWVGFKEEVEPRSTELECEAHHWAIGSQPRVMKSLNVNVTMIASQKNPAHTKTHVNREL